MKKILKILLVISLFVIMPFGWEVDKAFAVDDSLVFAGLNLQGDTGYLFRSNQLAVGIGSDMATIYDGMITGRLEMLVPQNGGNMVGIGIMINIPKAVTRLGGDWIATTINPSVGIVPVYDFNGGDVDIALVASIIKIEF